MTTPLLPRLAGPCVALCTFISTPLAMAGDVLVVDAGGGGDHTTIQAAVDAAASGDVLLVKPGVYPAFEVHGKGLTVVADGAGVEVMPPGIAVVGTLADQPVVLTGLTAHGEKLGELAIPALTLEDTRAGVRAEDCVFLGAPGGPCIDSCPGTTAVGGDAALLVRALDVSFVRCQLRGGDGTDWTFDTDNAGGRGLVGVGSQVSLQHCDVRGGNGGGPIIPGEIHFGGDGGHGVEAVDTASLPMVVHLSGSEVQGGQGGDGGICCLDPSGDGGHGVLLIGTGGAGCRGLQLASSLAGGMAGCAGGCGANEDGEALMLVGSALMTSLSGSARSLQVTSPVRAGQAMTFDIQGAPGDVYLVMRAPAPGFQPRPALMGVLLLDPASFAQPLLRGSLPAGGSIRVTLPAPKPPSGSEGQPLFLQLLLRDQASARWLATPATPVLLDPFL